MLFQGSKPLLAPPSSTPGVGYAQVTQQHHDSHLPNRGHVNGRLGSRARNVSFYASKAVPQRRRALTTHLVPDFLLKVFVCRDVETDGPVLEPFGFDLVRCSGHGRDDDVGDGEALLQGHRTGVYDMAWVVPRLLRFA